MQTQKRKKPVSVDIAGLDIHVPDVDQILQDLDAAAAGKVMEKQKKVAQEKKQEKNCDCCGCW